MMEVKSANQDLLALERSLKSQLQPIKPNQQFVGNLRLRLEDPSAYRRPRQTAYSLLAIAGGLLFGLVVFLIGKWIFQELN
jgi:hypothetical protein